MQERNAVAQRRKHAVEGNDRRRPSGVNGDAERGELQEISQNAEAEQAFRAERDLQHEEHDDELDDDEVDHGRPTGRRALEALILHKIIAALTSTAQHALEMHAAVAARRTMRTGDVALFAAEVACHSCWTGIAVGE